MHKGTVQVESRQSVGTTFTIQLPMRQEGELEADLQRNQAMDTLKEGALMEADQESLKTYLPELEKTEKEVVLIIDDNQDVRDYVKMLLGEEYLVIEAANGKEGLIKIAFDQMAVQGLIRRQLANKVLNRHLILCRIAEDTDVDLVGKSVPG